MSRSLVVGDFLDQAPSLRDTFIERFQRQRPYDERSFVWDYWHVPDQYTYFRTFGDRYFPAEQSDALIGRLRAWGTEILGCEAVTRPWLSYYIDGCVQELHRDVPHGPWAYVLSLTDWDHRGFSGGETVLLRPECLDFWSRFEPGRALEVNELMEQIVPAFNQLTVFDARVPHGVRMVSGTRDPLDSRLVLHGWFAPPRLLVDDDLSSERSMVALKLVLAHLQRGLGTTDSITGMLTIRVEFDDAGAVREARPLTNTLVSASQDGDAPQAVVDQVLDKVRQARIPDASEGSWAVFPLSVERSA